TVQYNFSIRTIHFNNLINPIYHIKSVMPAKAVILPFTIAMSAQIGRKNIIAYFVILIFTKNPHIRCTAEISMCKNHRFIRWFILRSEEHTSELQSRFDLVCRLLLEKKKKILATRKHVDNLIKHFNTIN